MHDYVIGLDGGGTKTDGVLVGQDGRVLARRCVGASNPNDVGEEASAAVVRALAEVLATEAGVHLADCFVFGGISGALNHREGLTARLRSAVPAPGGVAIDSDMVNLLSAELPDRDGACIICGTGSACFVRRGQEVFRIGGWGYLLDSAGSGYDIGRQALEAALRAQDGRGCPTALSAKLADALGAPVQDSLTRLYAEGKTLIASLSPAVFAAAREGDAVARAILDRNAAALAELLCAAWRRLCEGMPEDTRPTGMPVFLDGGICRHNHPAWRDAIASHIPPDVPAALSLASRPVIWGAAAEAMRRDGWTPDTIRHAGSVFLADPHISG
mgnify:FL=1